MYIVFLICVLMLSTPAVISAEPLTIAVSRAQSSPVVDGKLDEWGKDGWHKIPVKSAIEGDKDNRTGNIAVEVKTVISGKDFFIAARWPDKSESINYKNWVWKRKKYKRGKKLDDMFAVRFDMGGNYDICMIVEKTYKADVWLWSAGRSNPAGLANDMWHLVTTDMMEDAAEYKTPSGKIVYIKKYKDEGSPIFENTRPNRKKNVGDKLPGIKVLDNPSGSVADVKAKGIWKDGYWTLELSRSLDTKNEDDVAFQPGKKLLGAIAVYNKGTAEHKSVSGDLLFEFAN